jgi:hypothetical protein
MESDLQPNLNGQVAVTHSHTPNHKPAFGRVCVARKIAFAMTNESVLEDFSVAVSRRWKLAVRVLSGRTVRQKLSDDDRQYLAWLKKVYCSLPEPLPRQSRPFLEPSAIADYQDKTSRNPKAALRGDRKNSRLFRHPPKA